MTDLRCLFIVSRDPITPSSSGGGGAVHYEQLVSLLELGVRVSLWHYATGSEERSRFEEYTATENEIWRGISMRCESVSISTFPSTASILDRVRTRVTNALGGCRVENPLYRTTALSELRRIVREVRPNLVWANHWGPAQLAAVHAGLPFVYSHHDWLYRIKALRNHCASSRHARDSEEDVARRAAAVVTGSAVEAEELRKIGCRHVHYVPVSYEPVSFHAMKGSQGRPRLIHLGGMSTTANREGLLRFAEVAWERIKAAVGARVSLELVGDMAGSPAQLAPLLRDAVCHGFVADLTQIIRPFDIFFIPWEHSTGQRTKLPLAFNHAQAVVSTQAAVACYPEAIDGENCRLVERLTDMPAVVEELVSDPQQRERLGRAARRTFESCFTRQRLLPKYAAVLRDAGVA